MVTTFPYSSLDFMNRLWEIEEKLVITEPIGLAIAKVWHFMPDQRMSITDTPCVLNGFDFGSEDRRSSMGLEDYTVPIQILHSGADRNRVAEVLISFHDAFLTALGGDIQLGGSVTLQELEGASPTLGNVDYGGQIYLALQYALRIRVEKPRDYQ